MHLKCINMHYMRIKCNKNRINMQKIIKKFKKPPQNALHYQKNMYNYAHKSIFCGR